jgi:anti-sigma-K factor RskA
MSPDTPRDEMPLEGFDDVTALLRSLRDEDLTLDEPPADLWSRIEVRVVEPPAEPATELDAARRRRRRWTRPALAAAAAIAVIGGVTAVFVSRDDQPDEVAVVDLSNEGLDPRGESSHGTAKVIRLDDGSYALDVDVADLPPDPNGFFELWVIDPNVEGMVSLGPLRNGRVALPAGVDPQAFPIVDISIEPVDGLPTHSGDSILRGVIQA